MTEWLYFWLLTDVSCPSQKGEEDQVAEEEEAGGEEVAEITAEITAELSSRAKRRNLIVTMKMMVSIFGSFKQTCRLVTFQWVTAQLDPRQSVWDVRGLLMCMRNTDLQQCFTEIKTCVLLAEERENTQL